MVLVLKSNDDIIKLKQALSERATKKKFDARRFCGTLKVEQDALKIQQKLRNEWK